MRYDVLMWTGTVLVMVGALFAVIDVFGSMIKKKSLRLLGDDTAWVELMAKILLDKRSFLVALGLAVMAGTKYALG